MAGPPNRHAPASRLVTLFRGTPALAQELLPGDMQPRLVGGQALLFFTHTRLPRGQRWLPDRLATGTDHLGYYLAAEFEDGGAGSWMFDRATSSWLEARWGTRLGHYPSRRSSFDLREGPFDVELEVRRERNEEVYVRGEPTAATTSRVFPSARAAAAFLNECLETVRPDSSARLDDWVPSQAIEGTVAEPLSLSELRFRLLEDARLEGFEFDSAFRFVTRRLTPTTPVTTSFRAVMNGGDTQPAVPG